MAWWAGPVKGPSGRVEREEGGVEEGGEGGVGHAAQVGGAPLVIPIDWLINLGVRCSRKDHHRGAGTASRRGRGLEERKGEKHRVRCGNSTVRRIGRAR